MTMTTLQAIEDRILAADDPVVSVPELAEELDASDTHIRDKLELLEYEGRVERKDVGARATAWWHVERVTPPRVPPEEHPDQSDLEELKAREEREGDVWTVEEAADAVDLPGQAREKVADRREALAAVLRALRDGGEQPAERLREQTHQHETTHYDSSRSWWKNAASPALRDLADRGAVELVDHPTGTWRWVGEY